MDKIDMSLIMFLLANSRLSYAELAEKLNLSVNAVHKRIQLLIEIGVISKFTAKVSLLSAGAIIVFISGISQLDSIQELPAKMKANGSIYWLAEGGGKFLYIGAYLKSISDLPDVIAYVRKEAGIPEPKVGIMVSGTFLPPQKPADLTLCDLDYKIIQSLKENSRKAISDVSLELGISAKTVRRRLNRMIKNNLIELGLEWYPDKSNDIITLLDVRFKPEAEVAVVPYQILKKHSPNTMFYWAFANIPNTVTFALWTNSMNELQTLRESIEEDPRVESVVPNMLYRGYIFNTWRDHIGEKP